jgi:hypothetical protein
MHGSLAVKIIEDMPPGLPELYNHMMTRIEKVETIEPQYCKKVHVTVSLAYRRLTLPELAVLASLGPVWFLSIYVDTIEYLNTHCRFAFNINPKVVFRYSEVFKYPKSSDTLNYSSKKDQKVSI